MKPPFFVITPQMATDAAAITATFCPCDRCGRPGARIRIALLRTHTILVCEACAHVLDRVYREILVGPPPKRAGGRVEVIRVRR